MSTALGIASVSFVLVDLLNNGLIDNKVGDTVGGRVTVSALPPDRVVPANGTDNTQLNLFLFNVTPNLGWSNAGLPRQDHRGERVGNPPLALNLHYLLTAYGEKDFYAEILLGWAMQLLHEHPVLSRAEVASALATNTTETPATLPESLKHLSTSGLAEQVELIKITPEPLSTDEMSKLWTAFQTHYRSAAAYQASVVLIESKASTRAPLRVRDRNVYAQPLRRPVIASIVPDGRETEPIVAGDTIVIRGRQLAGELTLVRVGGTEVPPTSITDAEIKVALDAALPAGLQAVQIVHKQSLGTPPQTHAGVASNLASVTPTPVTKAFSPADPGFSSGTLSFDVSPDVLAGQRAVLLLNQLLDPVPAGAVAAAYSFELDPQLADTTTLSFDLTGIADGTYLVRIRVDGAESALTVDISTGRHNRR